MRTKLTILLSIFATICVTNRVYCGEDTLNSAKDTTIRFVQGVDEYNLVLEGGKQLFEYGTVLPQNNNRVQFKVENNSAKTIVITFVKTSSSGKLLVDLNKPGRNEEISPGESFWITVRPSDRQGPFSAQACIFYKTDGVEKELKIHVKGFLVPKPEPESKPVPGQPIDKEKLNGLGRFEIRELVKREKNKRDYSFALYVPPPRTEFGSVVKTNNDLVFSWDTLSVDELTSPLSFHFKNTSGYTITILKIERRGCSCVYHSNPTNQVLVMADSVLTLEILPDEYILGHFHYSLIIHYQDISGIKQLELKQWGFIPYEYGGTYREENPQLKTVKNAYLNQKYDQTIRLYVFKEGQTVSPDARLQFFSKDNTTIVSSMKDEHGDPFFRIDRKGWDTLLIHVLSPKGEIVQKTRLLNTYKYDYYGLPSFEVTGPHTYLMRRAPYKPLEGRYKLTPGDSPYSDIDPASIKKYTGNTSIRYLSNRMVEIRSLKQAIALEKRLLQLPSPVRLLPVVEGERLKWYSNSFVVIFYDDVSVNEVMKIFERYKITNYRRQSLDTRNSWTFSVKSVLDRKYITLLDQLWQLKEVMGLVQEMPEEAVLD